jgi:hypothetical protein
MKTVFLFLSVLLLAACVKSTVPDTTPSCIKQAMTNGQINGFTIGKIMSYSFQGDTVFLMEPPVPTADVPNPIYDKKCNLICSVGGFLSPNLTLCNGDIFSDKAIFIKTIWAK